MKTTHCQFKTIMFLIVSIICITMISCKQENELVRQVYFDELAANAPDISSAEIVWEASIDSIFEKELWIYSKKEKSSSNEYAEKLKNIFDVDIIVESVSNESYKRFDKNDRSLIIYDNGIIKYNKKHSDSNYQSVPITKDKKVLEEEATNFLRNNDLITDEFYFAGFNKLEITSIQPNGDKSSVVYSMETVFNRRIDGYEVIGNSSIRVGFLESGIDSVSISYSECFKYKKYKTITFEEAKKLILSQDSIFLSTNEFNDKIDKMVVTNIEIVYVDHSYDIKETHIQPCYRISGTIYSASQQSEFTAVIRAIPSNVTFKDA